MEQREIVLTASNIFREFQTAEGVLPVLKGLSLEINKGEMASVTGASGVGKSTLLHVLGGLDRPTSGEIKLGNIGLGSQSEKELARLRNSKVGFVFQSHYLLDDFTALENVMIPMLLGGRSSNQAIAKAELLLQKVSLIDRRSHRPKQLSGGEQQRVAVARSLANDPEIVLADEPSGNLDTATGRKLHDLLFSLNAEKSTSFVIATHNEELAQSCHRRFRMMDGKLLN